MQKGYFDTDWVFDLEAYPNCYLFCTVYANGSGIRVFEISDRVNQVEEMLDFLRKVKKGGYRLVGFNNIGFDYPVVHYILNKSTECKRKGEKLMSLLPSYTKLQCELLNQIEMVDLVAVSNSLMLLSHKLICSRFITSTTRHEQHL